MAPPLAGSPRVNGHRDYVVKAVLQGLKGPVEDKTYSEVMIPMGTNPDEWVAAVASYVRSSFGNSAGFVTPADVKRVRTATAARKTPWTVDELQATLPRPLAPEASWKLSASHNAPAARSALSMTAWNSQAPQAAGMWFQVELPQPALLTEVQFDSTSGGGRAGGGGGRGAAPGAPGEDPIPAVAGGAAAVAAGAQAPPAGAPGGGRGRGGAAAGAPQAPPNPGYPRGYKLDLSMNGTTWTPVATGAGSGATTTITFAPTQARFVRLTQTATGENAPPWSIQQLRLLEATRTAGK
jgi:hypothetical protein